MSDPTTKAPEPSPEAGDGSSFADLPEMGEDRSAERGPVEAPAPVEPERPDPGVADAPGDGQVEDPKPPAAPPAPDAEAAEPVEADGADGADGTDETDAGATDAAATTADDAETTGEGAATTGEGAATPAAVPTVRRRVSQEIARVLHAAGARFCFTVPGESFLPLIDDLEEAGIRVIATRHESGASFMAEALAQSTGRPQLVAVTRGVGASNASIGIHTARQDSAPLVALVGQVARSDRGREAFQEIDVVGSIGALAAWAEEPTDGAAAVQSLERAWRRLTTGRPGPLVLSVPEDVFADEVDAPADEDRRVPGALGPAADRTHVRRILKWLAASERGVIVAGGGVLRSRSTKRLVSLSEALAVPVVAAWRRPDVFPNDHPNYLGMAGYWSAPTVRARLADADVILFIGTRLNEITTYGYTIPGPDTTWAHVDVEPRTAHDGLAAPTLAVAGDASRFLDSAWSDLRGAALDQEMRERRLARMASDREAWKAASDVAQGSYAGPGVHPGRVIRIMRSILPDNAIITTDAGNMAGWIARGFRFRRAGTFLGPTSGAMGFGLPAAIAASLQDPDRIAVAVCGDGGFAMTMNELETAVREGAHPIAIVLDNERYGTIVMHQQREGRPIRATELGPVDFAGVAESMGALGIAVEETSQFEDALRRAITSRRPAVLHVRLDRAWMSVDDNPVRDGA